MTGLNVTQDRILEVASIITDDNLNIVSDEFEIVINQSEVVFESMIPWCQEQHNKVVNFTFVLSCNICTIYKFASSDCGIPNNYTTVNVAIFCRPDSLKLHEILYSMKKWPKKNSYTFLKNTYHTTLVL